jgi:hypothetical protein
LRIQIETYRRIQTTVVTAPVVHTRIIYKAIKGDDIDSRLAEYINCYPGNLNLVEMFQR